MSIASEITRINTNIENAYTQINTKGGTLPVTQNSNNLATAISSIPTGTTPTGTLNITQNGVYDVTNYASADVSVSGGSSEIFQYNNWISYGTTTPDATIYKYWFDINATPISKPLKYVANYRKADYYTGELEALIGDNTGTDTGKFQSSITTGGTHPDDYNNYFYSSGGQNALPTNITIYKYTYSNQEMPSAEYYNSSYATSIGKLSDLLSISSSIYTVWTAYNNTIYGCTSNTVNQYNVGTSAMSTWARTSSDIMSSSYRGIGLFRRSSSEMLIFRTNSSGTNLQALTLSSGGTLTTKATLSSLSNMTSYSSIKINSTTFLILYKTTSYNMTNENHKKMYIYNYSNSTFTQISPTFTSGYMYMRYLIPDKIHIFKFTADPENIYTVSSNGFATSSSPGYGNLVKAAFNYNTGTIGYKSGLTYRLCIPSSNFTIKDTNNNSYTCNFSNDLEYTYNIVQTYQDTNYNVTHEMKENYNSSDNVLLISNYADPDKYNLQSYKFYPRSEKDIFLWINRNTSPKFIYQMTEYDLKISDGTTWNTTDPENNIL